MKSNHNRHKNNHQYADTGEEYRRNTSEVSNFIERTTETFEARLDIIHCLNGFKELTMFLDDSHQSR